MKKFVTLILVCCFGMMLLAGCGKEQEADTAVKTEAADETQAADEVQAGDETEPVNEAQAGDETEPVDEVQPVNEAEAGNETDTDGLTCYEIEGVGTFYLPEGFQVESGSVEEPLPMSFAQLTLEDITVSASHFGPDAYESAGVPMPVDLEDYSQRAGVRQGLPEDAEFATDEYGNMYVQYEQDGTMVYLVLKKGAESYGSFVVYYPEGEESEEFAVWASKFVLAD